jgi:hypothetical protein
MFSKANLPTGTFSGYLKRSRTKATNFRTSPLLSQYNGHLRSSVTHDDNTVTYPLARK